MQKIFVLISSFVKKDKKHGIDRVVRNILHHWLNKNFSQIEIYPIYTKENKDGLFIPEFSTENFLEINISDDDRAAVLENGDILVLGLDRFIKSDSEQISTIFGLKEKGIKIYSIVHDLMLMNERTKKVWFKEDKEYHRDLLVKMHESEKIVCVSKTIRKETEAWMLKKCPQGDVKVDYFIEGCDIETEAYYHYSIPLADEIKFCIKNRPTFLQVSTFHPRKQHLQTLRAMELLWVSGYDVNIIFAGRLDPMSVILADDLHNHPEFGKRLHWLNEVNDAMLIELYKSSTALIMPSLAEGFGLPVVEAAHFGLPLILRDITVFRELAGEHAFYFKGMEPENLAQTIRAWLELHKAAKAPSVSGMNLITWKESAKMLFDCVTG